VELAVDLDARMAEIEKVSDVARYHSSRPGSTSGRVTLTRPSSPYRHYSHASVIVGCFEGERVMRTSPEPFAEFLADPAAVMPRIKMVAMANCDTRRRIALCGGPVRAIAFSVSGQEEERGQWTQVGRVRRAEGEDRQADGDGFINSADIINDHEAAREGTEAEGE
jgi:hypothetical protein